ncbi:DUF58 domain-containing protein [Bacteroidales bacterium OttesenSCG-928-B11]|nr:DUF58 domain-containing protein [Bacteroidales bacterium OttesenSCG-928-B11]MDL2326174.1 DUF58 domain-containing protein [Bacteroidales bacterium OttesenSCG-928-A14]
MDYKIDFSQITKYDNIELIAKQVVEGFITGMHKSPMHGFSVEFAEHRPYNTGESTRHIDWKLYGKTDKLFVKRYEEETNLRCQIVVDDSSSMYYPIQDKYSLQNPNKIFFSVYAAAVLMQIFKNQRDAVGLSLFSDALELHTNARGGESHYKMIYRELEKVLQPIGTNVQKKSMVVDVLHRIAEQIHKRSLVVIFSDMFESNENTDELMLALQHLRHNKHEVILFHTYHKKLEFDFAFENRLYKFVDMESGEEVKFHSNHIRDYYRAAIGDFFQELTLKTGQYQIDIVPADITKGFDQIILPYLLKRQKTV